MKLSKEEKEYLEGKHGNAAKKAMEILVALGKIYSAKRLITVDSVQISGVSYHTIGDAGLELLEDLAKDGKIKVPLTTLNPAGIDIENWQCLGIDKNFAEKQQRILSAFKKIGVIVSCTCTPYLIGNIPKYGSHIAWSESSAVCFANSIIGARTNRESGLSSLASAITGKTPDYGLHIEKNRKPKYLVEVKANLTDITDFGALGKIIGEKIGGEIPLIRGISDADLDELKSLCASIATFGGTALFHIKDLTPEKVKAPKKKLYITSADIEKAKNSFFDTNEYDFIAIGCPHASITEIQQIASALDGKMVKKEFWVFCARPVKKISDLMGYTEVIEKAGARFACDTCMAVAPLKGRFNGMITNSAKACFYGRGSNNFKVRLATLEECIKVALN
ncbi:MAG: aconitase X catalytic domain-containing protein [Candidatus Diapherotrites archaeon]|nr:aconitase X catalytic domain-containing protein [Candidatus Diapherotrites archaeon]